MSNRIKEKIGEFKVIEKNKKPYLVEFINNENYLRFKGCNCIKDFVKEITLKKYRGFKIVTINNRKKDITLLFKYLKKHKFNMKSGFIEYRCIFLKLYTHKYFNKNQKITHSNCVTFYGNLC